jgi:hypothetical protein
MNPYGVTLTCRRSHERIALPPATPPVLSPRPFRALCRQCQKVGFRALILKRAIEFNLAGSARNTMEGTVQFILQGRGSICQGCHGHCGTKRSPM